MGGTIRLFKFSGVTVYLHFSWFLIAAYQFSRRADLYNSKAWPPFKYIGLFAIVLLHKSAHPLPSRQTAGSADRTVPCPLAGTPFLNPPRRPAAMPWGI